VAYFFCFRIAHADHQPGDAIGFVDRQDTVGELDGLVDIPIASDEMKARSINSLFFDRCRSGRAARSRSRARVPPPRGVAGGQIVCPTCVSDFKSPLLGNCAELSDGLIGVWAKTEPGIARTVKATAAMVQR